MSKYARTKLNSKHLVVRPYLYSDYKACRRSHENRLPSINSFDQPLPVGSETYQEFKTRVNRFRDVGKKRLHYVFGVFSKKGEFIGQIDIYVFNQKLKWANLGYHVQNQHFGNGYAAEASRLVLKAGFKVFDLHRIEASMQPSNKASEKVARKLNLKYEGMRENFFPDEEGIHLKIYATNVFDHR